MPYTPDHDEFPNNHRDKKEPGDDHNHDREKLRDAERFRVSKEQKRQHNKPNSKHKK